MKIKFFSVFFLVLTFITFAEPPKINSSLKYNSGIGTIIKIEDKRTALSFFSLDANIIYPKIKSSISANSLNFFSDYKDYNFKAAVNSAKLGISFKSFGIRAFFYDFNIQFANLKLNKTTIREKNTNNKAFGLGYNIDYSFFKHNSNWFYGVGELSLNDFGSFIAKPFVSSLWGTIQDFQITKYYLFQFNFLNLNGNLKNKKNDEIAFYKLKFFEFKNKVSFEISESLKTELFISYLQAWLDFNVRLTAGNQGYFLFPYVFYNSDIKSSPILIGLGGSFKYKTNKLCLSSDIFFYSCVKGDFQNTVHSKEKKSFLFSGKEEFLQSTPFRLKSTHLLYIKLASEYQLTKRIKIAIDKHIPIPFFPKQDFPPDSDGEWQQADIDFFLSGTNLSMIFQL